MAELTAKRAAAITALTDRQDTGRRAITAGLAAAMLTTWRQFLLTRGASVRERTTPGAGQTNRAAAAVGFAASVRDAAALYQEEDVRALGERLAALSADAQRQAFNLQRQFQRSYLGVLDIRAPALRGALPPGRSGVDPGSVYQRPAETFRYERSVGTPFETALERAQERLSRLGEDDVMLASRDGGMSVVRDEALPITGYRRLLRPELARDGSCGLCIVAADRVYSREDLMPLHGRCHCVVAPIVDGADPGDVLNVEELDALYRGAGAGTGRSYSTKGQDLKKVRVQVSEHGELGPILHRSGDKLLTPEEVAARRRSSKTST